MKSENFDAVIVGAGTAGLSCARELLKNGLSVAILEADERIGGRIKTDRFEGFLLNHGFQVLQTAYPEARRQLDYSRLNLKPFAPGAIIRTKNGFYRISDPKRRLRDIWSTITAPIGSFPDRLRMIRMVARAQRGSVSDLFEKPDMTTVEYLRSEGFSSKMIHSFFKPFFGGVCLDPEIQASSRVFRYVLRIFANGDVALPAQGMGAIPDQFAEDLPEGVLRTGVKAESIQQSAVILSSGRRIECGAVILATAGPETERLLGKPYSIASRGEICLYFAAKEAPIQEPYLILNGEGEGVINSLTVPSIVADSYSSTGEALISVVIIGEISSYENFAESMVRKELVDWFGPVVHDWRHIKTYRIDHALPSQPPPMPDPTVQPKSPMPGVYTCGEYRSVPGIQWALLSGRQTAETVLRNFSLHR